MKKTILTCAAVMTLFVSCANGNGKQTYEEAAEELNAQLEAVFADKTLSDEEIEAEYNKLLKAAYLKHRDDSLGRDVFEAMVANSDNPEEILALYEKASDMIKTDRNIAARIDAVKVLQETSAGAAYKEVTGVDALTGEPLSLSSFFAEGGKPVLVDFWASWCSPCRKAIKNHLKALAETGKVTIVGIAVWEEGIEDTQKAMEELGVSWPVIYAGGREDSPSQLYGVTGIPTMILISPDGTILSRGHDYENNIAPFID